MLADFAVVPMGVGDGVKKLIAEALKIVDESGLSYKLGAMHTPSKEIQIGSWM